MSDTENNRPILKPLRVTCTSSNCSSGLHCFKKSRKMAKIERGHCRSCGIDLIDWGRIQQRDVKDANFIFSSLKTEMIRHHFWHKPIDEKAINHARRKGRSGLYLATKQRLLKHIAPINNPWDGRQTRYDENIIFYAQHALACCCRTCLEYWHGIPKDQVLADNDIEYFTQLIMMYINERLPDLTDLGEYVPHITQLRE